MPDYPLFKLCSNLYDVVPAVLAKTGKVGSAAGGAAGASLMGAGVLLQALTRLSRLF
jgi:hypothetical protein